MIMNHVMLLTITYTYKGNENMKKYKKFKNNFFCFFQCFCPYPYTYKGNENMKKYKNGEKKYYTKVMYLFCAI